MKRPEKRIREVRARVAVSLLTLAFVHCFGNSGAGDRILFGISGENGPVLASTTTNACASEISVTATSVVLAEDGDVTRVYSTSDPYYTDTDADAGIAWGFRSVEVCVYPVSAFDGTFEIPLSTTSEEAARFNILTTFPVAASGSWPGANVALPESLTFTGNGVTGHSATARQCFKIDRVIDAVSNPTRIGTMQVNLEEIVSDTLLDLEGKNPCDITATVEDDESKGVRVSSMSNATEEPGGSGSATGTFSVVLRQPPTNDVTVTLDDRNDPTNLPNGREGSVTTPAGKSLTFTNANWNVTQTVTVTAVDDLEVDGTKQWTLRLPPVTSADTEYDGLDPRDVVVTNFDKTVPGYDYADYLSTDRGTATGTVTGFATDQMNRMGSTYSRFSLKLKSKPTADVTMNFSNNRTDICDLITSSLTFTPSNYNTFQTVYVEGNSNGTDFATGNGNEDCTISYTVTTTDPTYSAEARPSFVVRSCDNDGTHLIQPCNFSGSNHGDSRSRLSAAEKTGAANTSATWLITRDAPGSDVTVGLSSSDTTEGTVPASVTITSSNYNTLTTGTNRVVLTHVDDLILDGSQNWTAITAAATGGLTYDGTDILASTTDNEQMWYSTVVGNTKEADGATTATIHLCLGVQNNTASVEITASGSGSEFGSITTANPVTFPVNSMIQADPPSNAACATDPNRQSFTVTGADDTIADGNVNFTVSFSRNTTDPNVTANPSNASVSNHDNEIGKRIFVATLNTQGEMSGVGNADTICNNNRPAGVASGTFKALIGSGATGPDSNPGLNPNITGRWGTTDGSTANPNNWVLSTNTNVKYYRCEGATGGASCRDADTSLFRANSNGLIPWPMDRAFSSNGADEFWTGMNVNLTIATQTSTPAQSGNDPDYRNNCAAWTYETAPNNPFPAYYGQTWTNATTPVSNTNIACTSSKKLICVEQ